MNTLPASPLPQAVVLMAPHCAHIVQFGSDHAHGSKVHEQLHLHGLQEHPDPLRHAFFGKVCDRLHGIAEVLVAGGNSGVADFRHFVETHRPDMAQRLRGYAVVERPNDTELLALARHWFSQHVAPQANEDPSNTPTQTHRPSCAEGNSGAGTPVPIF